MGNQITSFPSNTSQVNQHVNYQMTFLAFPQKKRKAFVPLKLQAFFFPLAFVWLFFRFVLKDNLLIAFHAAVVEESTIRYQQQFVIKFDLFIYF